MKGARRESARQREHLLDGNSGRQQLRVDRASDRRVAHDDDDEIQRLPLAPAVRESREIRTPRGIGDPDTDRLGRGPHGELPALRLQGLGPSFGNLPRPARHVFHGGPHHPLHGRADQLPRSVEHDQRRKQHEREEEEDELGSQPGAEDPSLAIQDQPHQVANQHPG